MKTKPGERKKKKTMPMVMRSRRISILGIKSKHPTKIK